MTRKHFIELAKSLNAAKPGTGKPGQGFGAEYNMGRLEQWERDVDFVADFCSKFNNNFDRAKFVEACNA